jgi:RimJ/RimL family protein N-acetyltransferase
VLDDATQNTEAAVDRLDRLLLDLDAFGDQHAGRVAIKTDLRNTRSERAIENLGAVREGVWRNHRVLSTRKYRHIVYYSIIDSEWPSVRQRFRSTTASARPGG